VSEASLRLLLPLGCSLRELDLYGACVKSRGATLLAAGYAKLEKLDLCGGHISGVGVASNYFSCQLPV
jgi:hypothetical protein